MKQQFRFLVAILLFLPFHIQGVEKRPSKLPQPISDTLINYILYNYDNLIADHYEHQTTYALPLAQRLHDPTQLPLQDCLALINDGAINTESDPVRYMLKLNALFKLKTGYFFVDD